MSFFKKTSNIIFLAIIFVLVVALAVSCFFVLRSHNKTVDAMATVSSVEQELASAQSKIEEDSSKIQEFDAQSQQAAAEKEQLQSQLQQQIDEGNRLKQENQDLKNQIEFLAAQKKRNELQKQIALANVNQAGVAESGICYLTFDDGPSDNTLRILDILNSYGVKATFFVIGTAKLQYLPRIQAEGHAIGLHTDTHIYSSVYSSEEGYLADLQAISDKVYATVGIRSNIIRFPGGSSNKVSKDFCAGIMSDLSVRVGTLGYSYFDWNVSSGDANGHNVRKNIIVNNVLSNAQRARAKGEESICVLMHDTSAKSTTVEALPEIIEGLHAMGYKFGVLTAETYGFHQTVIN